MALRGSGKFVPPEDASEDEEPIFRQQAPPPRRNRGHRAEAGVAGDRQGELQAAVASSSTQRSLREEKGGKAPRQGPSNSEYWVPTLN